MTSYDELMSAIVKKQIEIIGDKMALKQARNVPGVTVDNSGNVVGGSKAKLRVLLNSYKDIAGGVATIFAKKAIRPLLHGNEDLPEELR